MKIRSLLIILLLLAPIFRIVAQDDKIDEIQFEEVKLDEQSRDYGAIAGGYTGTFIFLNYDKINELANSALGIDFTGPIFLSGASGFTAVGIIPNIRIGVFGMGGTKIINKDITISNVDYIKGMEYTLSYFGFDIDYGIILMKSLAIVPGISAGWVTTRIESYQSEKSKDWSKFNETSTNSYFNMAEGNYFFVQPNLNLEYSLLPYLMFRGNVGYSLSFGPDWKYNRNLGMTGVPDGINASGLTVQFGIFLGLFNY